MKSSRFSLLSFFIFLATHSLAQIQTQYADQALMGERGYFNVTESGPINRLPKLDVVKLLEEDSLEANLAIPFRFGYAVDVNYNLNNSGSWYEIPEGKVWKLRIHAPEAFSINLIFDDLDLPEGGEMYLYNGNRTMVFGPITSQNYDDPGYFSTDLIQGDLITLELFEPLSSKGISRISISKVIHGYKNMFNFTNNFGNALACHNNVNCTDFSAWENESNSVAMVLLADNTRVCSGALLNNTCGDMTPNFLTAFHCIDTGITGNNPCDGETGNGLLNTAEINRAQNWLFRFQYKSPTCTPSTEPISWVTYNGSTFRAGWFDTDFALVEMNTRPNPTTGIQYAGWSRVTAPPDSGANIHHPSGDVMKISTYNAPAENSDAINWNFGCLPFTNTTPASTHWTVNLIDGTTEGGSSGSPLFDQNRRVVGQLHGGENGCAPVTKHYGKFDQSWNGGGTAQTRLRDWLDPNNTGAMTTNTVNLPNIAGPDLLCSPGTYTLQNLPAGSTASWSVIPASQFVNGSGTGTSAFMELSGNYTGIRAPRIVFTISTDCGNFQVDKTFWIGPPQVTYHPPGIDPCTANPYYSTISLPGFTYNWSVDNPNVWLTSNGQSITSVLSYNPEYFNITLEISDGNCTTSRTISSYTAGYYCQCFSDPACGNELALKVYPNPAAEMITVELDTANVSSIDRGFAQYELKLYTTSGEELLSQQVSSAKTLLDVRSLKNGFYYLHLIHKEGIIRKQIRIER